MNIVKFSIIAAALFALLLTAGCDPQANGGSSSASLSSASSASSSSTEAQKAEDVKKDEEGKEISIKVYYPNEDGTKLIAVVRKVRTDKTTDKYTAAMHSLMSGTKEKGQVSIIPKEAKLRHVTVQNGTAKVDFSKEFARKFTGGSTGEEMLVGSIVDTLTEFPEVQQVQFLIEGQPVETIAGHMDTTAPIMRMKELIAK